MIHRLLELAQPNLQIRLVNVYDFDHFPTTMLSNTISRSAVRPKSNIANKPATNHLSLPHLEILSPPVPRRLDILRDLVVGGVDGVATSVAAASSPSNGEINTHISGS